MKKISDKNFWIILIITIISLIILTVGVIFLTKKSEKEFYSAGYIISSNATKTDKYYFNESTVYKENVFNEYTFKDVDNKEVNIGKENFMHYLDNSLSFMKNGVILDLDNFNETLVPYYNITDKSIIKYSSGSYYVETADKTLIFGNFLGRITENKYIVVGKDVKIALAGNDNPVSGAYFEILFVEDGIVKIENQEGSYQTVSDGTIIYVGDNIKINLGDQSVFYGDEKKLSLSEMTIDGSENIDIKPAGGKVDKDNSPDGSDNSGENDGQNGNNPGENTEGSNTPGNNDGTNQGENGNGNGGPTSVIKKEVSVDLTDAKVDANTISASFQVIDTANFIKGNLILTLTNLQTGERVYTKMLANTPDIQKVNISSLSQDCSYLMTISEENNVSGTQYFSKTFKTERLDLRLIREFVTTTSLTYTLDFGVSSDVTSANISLYDENNKQVGETYTIKNNEDSTVVFSDLEANKNYHAVVDSVVFKNTNYASTYNINTSDITLKNKPIPGEISVSIKDDGQEFSLNMTEPTDVDDSITKYTYEIYKAEDITEDNITAVAPIYSFSSEELKTETLKSEVLKLGANEQDGPKDYRFKVVIEYNDNYKLNEIETGFSDYFQVVGKPVVEFTEDKVDFNYIEGTVKIKDDGCTVPNSGRECFDQSNNFIIRYYGGNTTVRQQIENVSFDAEEMTYGLKLYGLTENTLYTFEVYADVDMKDGKGLQEGRFIGSFAVLTKGIEALQMQNWKQNNYTYDTPISVNTEMISTVPESDYGSKIASLTFNLYKGDVKNSIGFPIGSFTETENIREKYYNKEFTLTSNMFGIENLDALRELSGGKLSRYYTVEVTDAFDSSGVNKFDIIDNKFVFETPAMLLLEDEVSSPEILVEEITNKQTGSNEFKEEYGITKDNKLGDDIIRGYKVTAVFDKSKIETYFSGSNPVTTLNFYVQNNHGETITSKKIDMTEEDKYTTCFFLDYGTDYSVNDKDMRRGNTYKFSYDISIDTNNDGESDAVFPSNRPISDAMTSIKKDPTFQMYIDSSTNDSITYKYTITDYDNALYKDKDLDKYLIYYKINNGETDFTSEIEKSTDMQTFTISNLSRSAIYGLSYYRASTKDAPPSRINMGSYYFDGNYDAKDYNLGYKLEYGNFDNRLKIIVDDNEFLNRVSAYLLTLSAGTDKYEKVISNLQTCDENKCIIIDYSDISAFKGKDIKVSLEAFYDTGYIGFSQKSLLGDYFQNKSLVEAKDASKLGFVYQQNSISEPGAYIYLRENKNSSGTITGYTYVASQTPQGILGFDLIPPTKVGEGWKLNTTNIVDFSNNNFIPYGTQNISNNSIILTSVGIKAADYYLNPKVLDKVNIQTDNNNFKFTSITPKVKTSLERLINGGIMNIDLSIDTTTLESDFIKTEGKYKFYIDIYQKKECEGSEECTEELIPVKTVETDYENLSQIEFQGLDPNTEYYYKISADMNKNGEKVKTPLFDFDRSGYVEYLGKFTTLAKEDILSRVNYSHSASSSNKDDEEKIYSKRNLTLNAILKENRNLDIEYILYDKDNNEVFKKVVSNSEITKNNSVYHSTYNRDITEEDLVFGDDYYTLVVSAVTTDLGKKLELFNDTLSDKGITGQKYHKLQNPTFKLDKTEAVIDTNNEGENIYGITTQIVVEDNDKVIKDGIYHIELQEPAPTEEGYVNACGVGHEDECRATIDILKDGVNITKKFTNLKPDTHYVIYVYADTYRNNLDLSEDEKNGLVYVRKSQYTKSDLGFSLGLVTPTAVSKSRLIITFNGAANLTSSLKGIEYGISVQGGEQIAAGKLGKTTKEDTKDLIFGIDPATKYPTLEITVPEGKQLGSNNYIQITYYYEDKDGNLVALKIGDKTVHSYGVIYER